MLSYDNLQIFIGKINNNTLIRSTIDVKTARLRVSKQTWSLESSPFRSNPNPRRGRKREKGRQSERNSWRQAVPAGNRGADKTIHLYVLS